MKEFVLIECNGAWGIIHVESGCQLSDCFEDEISAQNEVNKLIKALSL